jgi:hypothetical protein
MVSHHLSRQLADERVRDMHRAAAQSAHGAARPSRRPRRAMLTALRRSRVGRSKLIMIEDLGR